MTLNIEKFREVLGNLTVAIMINLHLINYAIVAARGTNTGFSTVLYSGFFIIAIIVWILQGKIKLEFKWLILFGVLILWRLVNESVSRISVVMLCAYVAMPLFIISNIKYNTERVLLYTILVSVTFIPGFTIMLSKTRFGVVDVDVAYSVLPAVIAGMVHFAYYRYTNKKATWILYIISIYYTFQLFVNGQRGPLACMTITIILIVAFQFNRDSSLKYKRTNKMILFISALMLTIIVFLEPFLRLLISLLQILNIDAYFITKTVRLLNAGDVMNGRGYLWGLAWEGFLTQPIFGNGFDSFQHFTGYPYPHNFILQSLYDGGLLFCLLLMAIFIIGIYRIIKNKNKDRIAMLVFLIGYGFVYPFLSQDMFSVFYLWALVAFLLLQKTDIDINDQYKEI